MTGTLTTIATTESDSMTHSNLRITQHPSISRLGAADVANVTQPEPAGAPGAFQGDPSGPPASLEDHYASEIKRREHIQFAALCFCLFLAGYNDGRSLFDFGLPPRLIYIWNRHDWTPPAHYPASLSRMYAPRSSK